MNEDRRGVMKDYTVVTGTVGSVEREVNKRLSAGWVLCGGAFSTGGRIRLGNYALSTEPEIGQAMTKELEAPDA